MINPYKITWNEFSSLDFDVLTDLAFDSDNGAVETRLSREAVVSETYNGELKRASGYKWNESLTFQMTLVKNDFGDFSSEENRRVLKWLTSRRTPGFINVYKDDSEVVEFAALGNFVNVSSYKLGNGRVVGYIADWESLTPYAFSDLYTVTKTISNATDNKITIEIDTDDSQPVYPRITVQGKGVVVPIAAGTKLTALSDMVENTVYFNGTTYYWKTAPSTDAAYFNSSTTNPNLKTTSVKIINTHTNILNQKKVLEPVVVKNSAGTEKIVIDGANKIISSGNTNRVFGDDFEGWRWLALYDGKNEIAIEGNCTVTIDYREIRKTGEALIV